MDNLVSYIIIEDNKKFNKEELYDSVIHAFEKLWVHSHSVLDNEWEEWVSEYHNQRKICKKISPKKFITLQEDLASDSFITYHSPNVSIIMTMPMFKSKAPISVQKAEVRDIYTLPGVIQPNKKLQKSIYITINKDLTMSLGKSVVAILHVIQYFLEDGYHLNDYNIHVHENIIINEEEYDYKVKDSGLTEVKPGSITASLKIIE